MRRRVRQPEGGRWKPGRPAVPAARSTERPNRPAVTPRALGPRPPSAGGTTTTGHLEARTSRLPSQRAPTSVEWPASMTTRSAWRLSSASTARRLPATTRGSTRWSRPRTSAMSSARRDCSAARALSSETTDGTRPPVAVSGACGRQARTATTRPPRTAACSTAHRRAPGEPLVGLTPTTMVCSRPRSARFMPSPLTPRRPCSGGRRRPRATSAPRRSRSRGPRLRR